MKFGRIVEEMQRATLEAALRRVARLLPHVFHVSRDAEADRVADRAERFVVVEATVAAALHLEGAAGDGAKPFDLARKANVVARSVEGGRDRGVAAGVERAPVAAGIFAVELQFAGELAAARRGVDALVVKVDVSPDVDLRGDAGRDGDVRVAHVEVAVDQDDDRALSARGRFDGE